MIDQNGFPGTRGEDGLFDGGDTCAILGTIVTLWPKWRGGIPFNGITFDDAKLKLFDCIGAGLVRHPDPLKWYSHPDRFSRDQLIPLICALRKLPVPTRQFVRRKHAANAYLCAWNTRKNGVMNPPRKMPDFTGPEVWALWIRVFQPWWGLLVLWLLDVETLIGSITWHFRRDRVSRNHMLVLLYSRDVRPTITSRIAYAIAPWKKMINAWRAHCDAVGEFQTAPLFDMARRYVMF
jgi:hypothetical protein